MDDVYRLLRDYNRELIQTGITSSDRWRGLQADQPPAYWSMVGQIALDLPRSYSCLEIGGGYGDVSAVLLYMGFRDVCCLERDPEVADLARRKLDDLLGRPDCVVTANYSITTDKRPNLVVLVNCVYVDGVADQDAYLKRLVDWHSYNGTPEVFVMETIDASFTGDHPDFPSHVRVSESQVCRVFTGFDIQSNETSRFPQNRSSKRLYVIRPSAEILKESLQSAKLPAAPYHGRF
jgi:hypothetical protein